jgi:hypothetical protein
MPPKLTASDRVRRAVKQQLKEAGDKLGLVLELTPVEGRYLEAACSAADRAAALEAKFDAEVAAGDDGNPNTMTKLAAEIRASEAAQMAALSKLKFTPDDGGAGHQAHLTAVRRAAARSRSTNAGGRRGAG